MFFPTEPIYVTHGEHMAFAFAFFQTGLLLTMRILFAPPHENEEYDDEYDDDF